MTLNDEESDTKQWITKEGKWNAWETKHQWLFEWRCFGRTKQFCDDFDTVKSLSEFFLKEFDEELSRGQLDFTKDQLKELNNLFEAANLSYIVFDEFHVSVCPVRLLLIKSRII